MSVLLNVTSGRGPAECRMAVAQVLAAIEREAAEAGVGVAVEPGEDPDGLGPLSADVVLDGEGAAAFARSWLGTVLWIARGAARENHGRRNWYVAVREVPLAALPPPLEPREVRFEAMRAGGPGGQHQNRTESAVRAVHLATGLAVVARDERSQHRNKALALARLALLLAARGEAEKAMADRRAWLDRIAVERGRPVRTYEGADFRRRG